MGEAVIALLSQCVPQTSGAKYKAKVVHCHLIVHAFLGALPRGRFMCRNAWSHFSPTFITHSPLAVRLRFQSFSVTDSVNYVYWDWGSLPCCFLAG